MRRILFFDIDGTLVDDRTQKVPESAIEGMLKAQENGSLLFVNTGRCKSFIPGCLSEIPFDGYTYACGAHIEYKEKVLFEAFVADKDIRLIRDAMKATGLQGIFQGPRYCYFDPDIVPYDNLARFMKMYDRDYHTERRNMYEEDMEINKLVTFRDDSCDYEKFLSLTQDKYQLIDNGGGFTEILPLPYTKASCMDYLLDYFRISRDECYVFGDSPNDLPMMLNTKNSICLGNGYDSVKEISGYVTTDIDDDGIYNALVHYGII